MTKTIAHFIDTDALGGAELLLKRFCIESQRRNFRSVALHFNNHLLKEALEEHGIESLSLPSHTDYKSIYRLPLFCLSFRSFIRSHAVDLVHSHLFGPVTASAIALAGSPIPHVGLFHDTYIIEERPKRALLVKLASLLGSTLVTVSEKMRCSIAQSAGISNDSLLTIHNGIDIPPKMESADRLRLTSELGLDPQDILFICVGRLVEVKRHIDLLEAFGLMCRRHPKLRLLLVGTGPEDRSLRQKVRDLKLENKVDFLGFREDIAALLQIADCFVLASRSEGLSCSILEAMAAGLPAIVTDVGGNSELIEHERNGFLVQPYRPEELAQAMTRIVESPEIRRQFGSCSKDVIAERFDNRLIFDKWFSLYDRLLTKKPNTSV